jgi:alpha-methylacyl-CoA racemase
MGVWNADERADNLLDGGAPFYGCYQCADGEYVALGALEPQFYALLREKAGLAEEIFDEQHNRASWPRMRARLAEIMRGRTRDEWCSLLEGSDVCFAPVLRFTEAHEHPAARARNSYFELDGVWQPAPAPRFSRTPSAVAHGVHGAGQDTQQVLGAMGFEAQEIDALLKGGSIA